MGHVVGVLVAAHRQEAGEGELAHGPGPAQGGGHGGGVQVGQHRAGARVDGQVLCLLAGVLHGQEHGLGGGPSRPVEGIEQGHRVLGQRLVQIGEPLRRQGPPLLEVGGREVDHFVQRGGEGDLGRGDRGLAGVGRLEDARIDHDLRRGGGSLGPEADPQAVVARQRPGEAGDRRGHPLVAGDDGLDGPLLRRQDLGEHGLPRHSPSFSHAAIAGGPRRAAGGPAC